MVDCLVSGGQHVGRKFLGVKKASFMNEAWRDSTRPIVSDPKGQQKLAAELRRLRYARLDASQLKQPRMYAAWDRKLKFLAGFVVKVKKNRYGVAVRINATTALPIGQAKLGLDGIVSDFTEGTSTEHSLVSE